MSRFKTELCNNLIELGCCKYGDRCHYAHGLHELRQVSRRHPKYRTERCKNFELTGKCPFGPRCSYVHPKPDLDSMIEQLSKYMKHTKAPKPDSEDDDEDDISFFSSENRVTAAEAAAAAAAVAASAAAAAASTAPAAAASLSNTSMIRTPLGSNNSTNILPSMNLSNINLQSSNLQQIANNQASSPPLDQTSDRFNGIGLKSLLSPITSTGYKGAYIDSFSFNESISFENVNKKPRLISSSNSQTSGSNNSASNPFGIRNPLSDYINNTNINGKSPLQPNKQYYTRF